MIFDFEKEKLEKCNKEEYKFLAHWGAHRDTNGNSKTSLYQTFEISIEDNLGFVWDRFGTSKDFFELLLSNKIIDYSHGFFDYNESIESGYEFETYFINKKEIFKLFEKLELGE